MVLNKKSIFLLDGVGAAVSALFTGLLLPLFTTEIGLPAEVLYSLATLPILCSIYSFSCHFAKKFHPWMLFGIMAANIFYCLISAALIFTYESMTSWGIALLLAEIFVVIFVITLEVKVYYQKA